MRGTRRNENELTPIHGGQPVVSQMLRQQVESRSIAAKVHGSCMLPGRARLVEATDFFGDPVLLDGEIPRVVATVLRSHTRCTDEGSKLRGQRERVLGWNAGELEGDDVLSLWCPGSSCAEARVMVGEDGFWRCA